MSLSLTQASRVRQRNYKKSDSSILAYKYALALKHLGNCHAHKLRVLLIAVRFSGIPWLRCAYYSQKYIESILLLVRQHSNKRV